MGAMKPWHWVVVLIVVLLLFGAKRLPDLAKSVGQSMKIFKKEIGDLTSDDTPPPAIDAAPATPAPPAVSVTKPPIAPAQPAGSEGSTPPQV